MALQRPRPILIVVAACFLSIPIAGAQTIWYVDAAACPGPGSGSQGDPFCKIQDALNAAAANAYPPDEIIVADGIYTGSGNKDLDFHGKDVTLRSASGNPAACIIDCQFAGRGFFFHSGETAATGVEGLTVRNGLVTSTSPGRASGGGVHCQDSSPTLSNCVISGNTVITNTYAGGLGGGVSCEDSSPTLNNCTISDNTVTDAGYMGASGGGVFCSGGSPTLVSCTISGNTLTTTFYGTGGGIHCSSSSNPTLTNCTITGNTFTGTEFSSGGGMYCASSSNPTLTNCTINDNTAFEGGGAYCDTTSPTFIHCTINGNTATGGIRSAGGGVSCYYDANPTLTNCAISENTAFDGGGVYCYSYSSPTLTNCAISGNSAANYGGGLACGLFATPVLTNCAIAGNWAGDLGGGVACEIASPGLINCTFSNNTAVNGGGVSCAYGANPTLTNCILWADAPQEIYVYVDLYYPSTPVVAYSDLQGGWAGVGNIGADPLFADTANGDYRLLPSSPCIDAGSNAAVPAELLDLDGDGNTTEPLPFDLDGNPRFSRCCPLHITLPPPGHPMPPPPPPIVVDMGAYEFMPAPLPEPQDVPTDRSDALPAPQRKAAPRK